MHVKIFDNKYHKYILCAQSSELQYFSIEYKLDILKLNMKSRILSKQFTLKYSFFFRSNQSYSLPGTDCIAQPK